MPNTFLERLPFVFLFGVAFAVMLAGMGAGAWLLGKLVKALRRLALSPEERQKQAAAARHPFAGVSLRGKEAWLVCCLEEALVACGLDAEQGEPGSWYPLLALLWKFPELPEEFIEDWLDETADILPSSVLSCDPGGPGELSQGEKERSAAACALYATARARMALLGPLVEFPVRLVRENQEDPAARPKLALALLDEVGELLESYGVPLPAPWVRDFLLAQRSPGLGDRFVGRQCSGFVGW